MNALKVRMKLNLYIKPLNERTEQMQSESIFRFPHPILLIRAKSHDFNLQSIERQKKNKAHIAINANERTPAHDRVLNLGACSHHALFYVFGVIYFLFHFHCCCWCLLSLLLVAVTCLSSCKQNQERIRLHHSQICCAPIRTY